VPAAASGIIAVDDEVDRWTISGTKGQQLSIRVDARKLHSLLDPVLTLKAEDGKQIKEADDRSKQDLDAEMSVKLPADGSYTVEVRDRYGTSGPRHFYLLTCETPTPVYSATLAASEFVFPAEGSLDIPVKIERQHGHDAAITVALQGLPDGLECPPVVSEGTGDTSKQVTLKLTRAADATSGFSGVIRVHCSDEASGAGQSATAALPRSLGQTQLIWLTVPATTGDTADTAVEQEAPSPAK
jgi:hypothetical protein